MKEIYGKNLFDFAELVKTIRYGYVDSDGKLHFAEDPDFKVHQYVFSSPKQVVRNKCGWCWDVANLIAEYCKYNQMDHYYLFMEYFTEKLHQTHTQVFAHWEGKWYAFPDNSAPEKFGQKGFDNLEDCVKDFTGQFEAYLQYVLKDAYDREQLLLREITVDVPAGISDEVYLALVRGQN